MEIIPAILPQNFAELEDKLAMIKGIAKTVQVDICDGKFVPSQTWPYKKEDDNFAAIVNQTEGMPFWESFDFEFDLMVSKPVELIPDWIAAGATRIVLHAGSDDDLTSAFDAMGNIVEAGLAVRSSTNISEIERYKDRITFVQCMGIDKVGFQGQPFDEKILDKIKEIKAAWPDLQVSVDGSVNEETASKLKEAGADRLVIGSALFNAHNIVQAFQEFKRV